MNTIIRIQLFITALLLCLFLNYRAQAQLKDPVKWSYAVKKTSANSFTVYLKAVMEKGWHIYAKDQLKDAVGVPTSIDFSFDKSKIKPIGKLAETGKKVTEKVDALDVTQFYFSGQVTYAQSFSAKLGSDKIACKVEYMACNESQCLPVKETTFNIQLPK